MGAFYRAVQRAFLPLLVLRERVGVRVRAVDAIRQFSIDCAEPSPCPLPEYREREVFAAALYFFSYPRG
jgi:hypothetical protein